MDTYSVRHEREDLDPEILLISFALESWARAHGKNEKIYDRLRQSLDGLESLNHILRNNADDAQTIIAAMDALRYDNSLNNNEKAYVDSKFPLIAKIFEESSISVENSIM